MASALIDNRLIFLFGNHHAIQSATSDNYLRDRKLPCKYLHRIRSINAISHGILPSLIEKTPGNQQFRRHCIT